MDDTQLAIELYFKDWKQTLNKCKSLLDKDKYYPEAILLLCCYIGALATLRYPSRQVKDNVKYKKIVSDYSGMNDLYEQIDLLFFYQWPLSDFKDHGEYKKLKDHEQIVKILKKKYGDEEDVKEKIRFISQKDFTEYVLLEDPSLDRINLQRYLPLFSLIEELYQYLRCYAVHNAIFKFINKVTLDDGSTVYQDNHKITGSVLLQTVDNILNNLESECISKRKWPEKL